MPALQPLRPPDSHYVDAAIGWLELGNVSEATEELERIHPRRRAHPDVLEVRVAIFAAAKKWDEASIIAKTVNALVPERVQSWVDFAYATRRATDGGFAAAYEILSEGNARHPREPSVTYNLACCACQLGKLREAERWLADTFAAKDRKDWLFTALNDSDLEPLWKEIGNL